MCEAARLAPSACNSQTWRFVAVTDRETIRRICCEAMRPVIPNRWLEQAPLIIVGCSRLDLVANRIGTAVTGTEYYRIDLGIAMEHMVLKATELGLGTCWIGWFREEKIRELLDIPKKIMVSALLAVGYPKEPVMTKRSRKPLRDILFRDRWGKSFHEP
jgi:nitroreductase